MTARYDVIVAGTGGVGSAALDHLARRGARVVGLDRFGPAHDRGSSHGRTRLIRQAYFEHADYVPLVLRAYEHWAELEARRGQKLYHEVGLLQVGPADGAVVPGVLRSAQQHGLAVEPLTGEQVARRFGGFRAPAPMVGVFERRAGYLDVEDCVRAHLTSAEALSAELHFGEEVRGWRAEGGGVRVETDREVYLADRLILTVGSWAGQLLAELGIPLVVRRKPLFWFRPLDESYRVEHGCPGFLYETPAGFFYGFPQLDEMGVKAAEHTGGEIVPDPLTVNRDLNPADVEPVTKFLAACLPRVSHEVLHHSVCLYTLTPDQHFVVDVHPQHPQVSFAAGLSGHGFKFTPTLGEALADLALEGRTALPIGFLSVTRPALKS